jgi:hypothetical protein
MARAFMLVDGRMLGIEPARAWCCSARRLRSSSGYARGEGLLRFARPAPGIFGPILLTRIKIGNAAATII